MQHFLEFPNSFVIEFVQIFHEIRFCVLLMPLCVCDRLSHPCLCSFLLLFGPLDALRVAGRTVFRSCCAWWPLVENVISGSNGRIKEKKKNDNTVEGQILIVLLRALGFRQAECKNLLQAFSCSEIVRAKKQEWGEKIEKATCHASLFAIWRSTRFTQSSSIPRLSDDV